MTATLSLNAIQPTTVAAGVSVKQFRYIVFTLTYGTTVNIDASLGNYALLTVTNGTAFTVAAPTNPTSGQTLAIEFLNSSGGAMGAVTWNAAFKLAGALTNPGNNARRKIWFTYNGSNWIEDARSVADIT